MERDMKETGRMTYSTVEERKLGLMGRYMKEITYKVKSTDLEFILGTMDLAMRGIGKRTRSKAMVPTHGLMVVNTKVNGLITIWKE
jgi:hypothetical protein